MPKVPQNYADFRRRQTVACENGESGGMRRRDSPEYCQTLTVYTHAVLSISLVVLQRVARHVSSAMHGSAVQTEPGTLLGAAYYARQ